MWTRLCWSTLSGWQHGGWRRAGARTTRSCGAAPCPAQPRTPSTCGLRCTAEALRCTAAALRCTAAARLWRAVVPRLAKVARLVVVWGVQGAVVLVPPAAPPCGEASGARAARLTRFCVQCDVYRAQAPGIQIVGQ